MRSRAFGSEASVLSYVLPGAVKPAIPPAAAAFTHHRHVAPVLWALLGACLIETAVAHLVVGLFLGETAALVLLAISAFGLVYLVGVINSFRRLPFLITDEAVRIRLGLLIDTEIGLANVRSVEHLADCGDTRRPGFLKASLLAPPSVVIELSAPIRPRRPLRGRAEVTTVGIRPDEPDAFVAALQEAQRRHREIGG